MVHKGHIGHGGTGRTYGCMSDMWVYGGNARFVVLSFGHMVYVGYAPACPNDKRTYGAYRCPGLSGFVLKCLDSPNMSVLWGFVVVRYVPFMPI